MIKINKPSEYPRLVSRLLTCHCRSREVEIATNMSLQGKRRLSTDMFPSLSKSALVRPLAKKSMLDVNVLSNHSQLVSNLSILSKIMEKVDFIQLCVYLQ